MVKTRAYIRIYGIVQDVGYRFFTERYAKTFKLKGYVRNRADGSVEVVVEGDEEKIEELIEHLRRGPFLARVERIDIIYGEPKGDFDDFYILF